MLGKSAGSWACAVGRCPRRCGNREASRSAEGTGAAATGLVGPNSHTEADDPRHVLQEHRGLADFWDLDDGDIFCHPQ